MRIAVGTALFIMFISGCKKPENRVKFLTDNGLTVQEREALEAEREQEQRNEQERERQSECAQEDAEKVCIELLFSKSEEEKMIEDSINYTVSEIIEQKPPAVALKYRTCKFSYKITAEDDSIVSFIGSYQLENDSKCSTGGGEIREVQPYASIETGESDVDQI